MPGRNISADLFMEHLNRELKSAIASCSGKTEEGILRLGKAIGTVAPVLQHFDEIGNIKHHETRHKATTVPWKKIYSRLLINTRSSVMYQDGYSLHSPIRNRYCTKKKMKF